MTGLVIKLAPRERVLINGAVVENGDRRSRINILTQNAKVLRLRDAIHPDRANTPVSRLCYTLQLVLIGEAAADETNAARKSYLSDLPDNFGLQDNLS